MPAVHHLNNTRTYTKENKAASNQPAQALECHSQVSSDETQCERATLTDLHQPGAQHIEPPGLAFDTNAGAKALSRKSASAPRLRDTMANEERSGMR